MKRWLWFFSAIIISTGVYFTIRYGLRPKPIPVMNATEFEEPQQIGAVIYRRLRQEIRAERVILLGSAPDLLNYEEIWNGFLKTALADSVKVDVFYQREGLQTPQNFAGWQLVPFTSAMVQSGEFMADVKSHMQSGHLVVIHAATEEVSHLSANSLSRQLDEVAHHPVLALSTLSLSLNPQEQSALQQQCLVAAGEGDGHQRLECAEAHVSKTLMKKKPGKIWAVMERHGLKEYLIFVHR